jgi:hypothetical protein
MQKFETAIVPGKKRHCRRHGLWQLRANNKKPSKRKKTPLMFIQNMVFGKKQKQVPLAKTQVYIIIYTP